MPRQEIWTWSHFRRARYHNLSSVSGIVFVPIFELFFDPSANLQTIFRRHRDIAAVKERVHVLPEENAIRYRMGPTFRVGSNVRCFQNVQNRRVRKRAAPLVGIGNQNAKRSLPQARHDHLWGAKARPFLDDFHGQNVSTLAKFQPILNLLPNRESSLITCCVTSPLNNVGSPIRCRNPLVLWKEKRRLKKNAANFIILERA